MKIDIDGHPVEIDSPDYHSLKRYKLKIVGKGKPYLVGVKDGKIYQVSRLIMKPPSTYVVAYRNGDTLNLTWSNLFVCTRSEARRLRRPPKVDQLPSGRWRARIRLFGRRVTVGTFDTEREALEAIATKAYGESRKEIRGREYLLKRERLKVVDEERI